MTQSLISQTKKLTYTFTDVNGDAADPSAITLKIYRLEPGGSLALLATYSKADMTNDATGSWYIYYTPEQAGKYYADLFTTEDAGTPSVAVRAEFDVASALG